MSENAKGGGARELFWRRLAAGAVDILVLLVAASLAGVLLYAGTDGKLRSSTFLKNTACQPAHAISVKLLQGIAAPPGARPVAAQLCVTSVAGMEISRSATIVLQAQEGELTRSLAFSRPVDRQGLPMRPVILDWVYPLAFILMMALCEGLFGTTLGKRLLGLKVTDESGQRPAGVGRALVRNLVIYGGVALVLVTPLVLAVTGLRLAPLAYYAAVGVFGVLVLAPFAMLAEATARPLYDRWAGADVVRT